jgi:hypothetical protein
MHPREVDTGHEAPPKVLHSIYLMLLLLLESERLGEVARSELRELKVHKVSLKPHLASLLENNNQIVWVCAISFNKCNLRRTTWAPKVPADIDTENTRVPNAWPSTRVNVKKFLKQTMYRTWGTQCDK